MTDSLWKELPKSSFRDLCFVISGRVRFLFFEELNRNLSRESSFLKTHSLKKRPEKTFVLNFFLSFMFIILGAIEEASEYLHSKVVNAPRLAPTTSSIQTQE